MSKRVDWSVVDLDIGILPDRTVAARHSISYNAVFLRRKKLMRAPIGHTCKPRNVLSRAVLLDHRLSRLRSTVLQYWLHFGGLRGRG